MMVLYSLIACCMPRNGLRWTRRWGWSLGTPGLGSFKLVCFGLWLGLLVPCLCSTCTLACSGKKLFFIFPHLFPCTTAETLRLLLFGFFFHLNCFGLQSREPTWAVGKTQASKRKDTKTHQFCLLWGAHQHQKLNRFLSTFCLSCCVNFFSSLPWDKGSSHHPCLLAVQPGGWHGVWSSISFLSCALWVSCFVNKQVCFIFFPQFHP